MTKPYENYFIDERQEKMMLSALLKLFFVFLLLLTISSVFTGVMHDNFMYFKVTGESMMPSFNPDGEVINGEYVQDGVIVKLNSKVTHGDVIVLKPIDRSLPSDEESKTIIKRVIGLEGDLVTIKVNDEGEFRVYRQKVNETTIEELYEPYIDYSHWQVGSTSRYNNIEYDPKFYTGLLAGGEDHEKNIYHVGDTLFYKVPKGEVLFLGDNRAASKDSRNRDYGSQSLDRIIGKVVYTVHDVANVNPYFVELVGFSRFIFNSIKNWFV